MGWRALLGLAVALASVGCGLDESGLADGNPPDGGPTLDSSNGVDGSGVDGSGVDDSGVDGSPDAVTTPHEAGVCDDDANECQLPEVPVGWSPIAYVEGAPTACPASWSTPDDYVTVTTQGNAACACACTKTSDPSCTTGSLATFYSNNGSCGAQGVTVTYTNGACKTLNGSLANAFAATPIAPSGGSCSVQAQLSGAIQTAPARLCIPDSGCESVTCGGYAPAGFAACIVSDGDVACPSGSSFNVKHSISKSASASCAPTCGTGCTLKGTCDSPKFHGYTDGACGSSLVALAADGTCVATNHGGENIGSTRYSATPNFPVCTAAGATSVQVDRTTPRTVCCKP